MSFIGDEIARQPAAWRKAAVIGAGVGDRLPRHGERVAVVGCGTSWFIAEAYAALREKRGLGQSDFFAASEFPDGRAYDRIVAISRSGTTTEILDVLTRQGHTCRTVALTASSTAPIAEVAHDTIDLSFADERSVVQTLFATTALATLRASLGESIDPLSDAAEAILAEPLLQEWVSAGQITFLGRGWAHGIAREAALKLRETARSWTEAHPSMEYRHGPVAIAEPGRLVWHFGADTAHLQDLVTSSGALFVNHAEDPQVDLIRVQRLAVARANVAGLDPDLPRNLNRSVVLQGEHNE